MSVKNKENIDLSINNSLNAIHESLQEKADNCSLYQLNGRVIQVTEILLKAIVPQVKIGELCLLRNVGESKTTPAEVVGFDHDTVLLAPVGDLTGVSTLTEVIPTGTSLNVKVGEGLLGCILDGLGNVLAQNSKTDVLSLDEEYPICSPPPDPLKRKPIDTSLVTGIRAIDGVLTVGEGQRMGILSSAGVGKSVLLSMLTQKTDVDIIVVALIGERGKEVKEFIDSTLDESTRKKAIMVVATSDRPAIERVKAAHTATAIAEYYRDKGKKVLLLMDSLTRFARALREIGIATGEAPVNSGFPPSVYTELPKLVERAGQSEHGSITAFYSVLVEGDETSDTMADEIVSLLDGHMILSRELAGASHYPAIDILKSLSRVMATIASPEHIQSAAKVRKLLAKYKEIEFLVKVGEYQKGSDKEADEALDKNDTINQFLQQSTAEKPTFTETLESLNNATR